MSVLNNNHDDVVNKELASVVVKYNSNKKNSYSDEIFLKVYSEFRDVYINQNIEAAGDFKKNFAILNFTEEELRLATLSNAIVDFSFFLREKTDLLRAECEILKKGLISKPEEERSNFSKLLSDNYAALTNLDDLEKLFTNLILTMTSNDEYSLTDDEMLTEYNNSISKPSNTVKDEIVNQFRVIKPIKLEGK